MPANDLPWRKWIPKLVIALCALVVLALAVPFFQSLRESARRSQSKDTLKQLGLALHSYYDAYGSFPPGGTFTADGTPMHGWVARIWPYLEKNYSYDRIDFDQPWDDSLNRHIFQSEFVSNPHIKAIRTSELFGLMHYPGNAALLPSNGSVRLKDITAGTSNTWICAETFADWQPWGSPFNGIDLQWPPPIAEGETGWRGGGGHLLMADGSVQFFAKDANQNQPFQDMIGWKPDRPVPPIKRDVPKWEYLPRLKTIALFYQSHLEFVEDHTEVPEVTPEKLADAVRGKSGARVLIAEGLGLTRGTLGSVMKLKNLEYLSMGRVSLTDEELQHLAELKSLRMLDVVVDTETAKRLKELLPDCELRLYIVDEEASENDSDPKTESLPPDDDP